uniref:Uncharacterized protein n=1 Tax=Romanomermis culicivorax TaxID=13658 RepID=A0A915HIS0_ROMCU
MDKANKNKYKKKMPDAGRIQIIVEKCISGPWSFIHQKIVGRSIEEISPSARPFTDDVPGPRIGHETSSTSFIPEIFGVAVRPTSSQNVLRSASFFQIIAESPQQIEAAIGDVSVVAVIQESSAGLFVAAGYETGTAPFIHVVVTVHKKSSRAILSARMPEGGVEYSTE